MFVTKLTFNRVAAERDLLRMRVSELETNIKLHEIAMRTLQCEIDTLRRLRRQGTADALDSHRRQFNDADLKRLLQLCHPDKHGGKASAIEMTQRLNQLRRQQ